MEFPEVGSHCTITSCKQDDFLPFICAYCSQIFCKNHFAPSSHDCESTPDNIVLEIKRITGFICSQESCNSSSPVEMNCIKCEKHFCLAHRFHGCLEISEAENFEKLKAWEKPMEDFTIAKSAVDAVIHKNLKKSKNIGMANKIQLMKLKSKAAGSQLIPTVDRRYFLVYPPLSYKKEAQAVFVCVRWTIGKTIDTIADLIDVRNSNNLASAEKLRMFHYTTGNVVADKMDSVLAELFNDSELIDGESVILEYCNENKVDASFYK